MDTIRAWHGKTIGRARRVESWELRSIIIEGITVGKRTAGCPQNSNVGQIENGARIETFKVLNEMAEQSNRMMNYCCIPTYELKKSN